MPFATPAMMKLAAGAALTMAVLAILLFQGTAAAGNMPPSQPSNPMANLIASERHEPQVRVSWDNPGDATVTGYLLVRSDGRSFTSDGQATTYTDTEIRPGTAYAYTVTAKNASGNSPASDPASVRVPDAPTAPGNPQAEPGTPTPADETISIHLSWTAATVPEPGECEDSHPVTGYTVTREAENGEVEKIAALGSGATSFTDGNAAFGTTYTYGITAANAMGNSPTAQVAIQVSSRPVAPPTGLTVSIADPFDGNVNLAWNAPAVGPDIAGYGVFRYEGTNDPLQGTEVPTILAELATGTTLTDDTAQAGTTYAYIVLARSADNISEPSNTAVMEAPAPATGVSASVDSGAVSLSWEAPAMGATGSYLVQRMASSGEWTQVAEAAETTHVDDTAPADDSYTYRVQHRNQYGGSAWATSNQVTLLGLPPKVTGVSATVSGDDIVVNWDTPGTGAVATYQVSYGPQDSEERDSASVTAPATSFTHSGNTEGVTYEYTVRALNEAGDGPWSDPATAMRMNLPQPPTGVNRGGQRGGHHRDLGGPSVRHHRVLRRPVWRDRFRRHHHGECRDGPHPPRPRQPKGRHPVHLPSQVGERRRTQRLDRSGTGNEGHAAPSTLRTDHRHKRRRHRGLLDRTWQRHNRPLRNRTPGAQQRPVDQEQRGLRRQRLDPRRAHPGNPVSVPGAQRQQRRGQRLGGPGQPDALPGRPAPRERPNQHRQHHIRGAPVETAQRTAESPPTT